MQKRDSQLTLSEEKAQKNFDPNAIYIPLFTEGSKKV